MKGFKKRTACLLSFLVLAGGLGACTEKEESVYTIDYYFIQSGTFTPQDLDVVEEAMNEILVEKIEAKVKLHPIAAWSYDEKLNLIINSGDKFDICYTSSWTNNYKEKIGKEAYLDITELLPEYAPTLYANIDPALKEHTLTVIRENNYIPLRRPRRNTRRSAAEGGRIAVLFCDMPHQWNESYFSRSYAAGIEAVCTAYRVETEFRIYRL